MQEPIDFSLLLKDMSKARQFLGETHATMRGEMKQQFGGLLRHLDHHLEDVKTKVPECHREFAKEHKRQIQAHEANKRQLAELTKEYEQLKKQIAEGNIPQPPMPAEAPVKPELGQELRNELLDRFMPDQEAPSSTQGVAWQNWNLDGAWTHGVQDPK